MGRGRSGSTFLENIISEQSQIPLLGESRLWPIVYNEENTCTCGKKQIECEFWSQAVQTLPDSANVRAAFLRTIKRKMLLSLFLPNSIAKLVYADEISAIAKFYRHLCNTHSISQVIDSSKNPAFGRLLALSPGFEVHFCHIVRHPLGVAFSWKRQRASNSKHKLHKQRKSLVIASLEWLVSNILSELVKWRMVGNHNTLFYEKLTDVDLLAKLNVSKKMNEATVEGYHAIAGNPSENSRSKVFILDENWKNGLRFPEKLLCLLLVAPMLLYYGYRR